MVVPTSWSASNFGDLLRPRRLRVRGGTEPAHERKQLRLAAVLVVARVGVGVVGRVGEGRVVLGNSSVGGGVAASSAR